VVSKARSDHTPDEDPLEQVQILDQKELPLASIKLDPENARKRGLDAKLDELKQSIQRLGLIQPIVVFQSNDGYELVSGQRRYLAFAQLGRTKIPAIIIGSPRPTTRAVISLSENIQRRKLLPEDVVPAVCGLFDRYRGKPAQRIKRIETDLGLSRRKVVGYLALRLVPKEVLKLVSTRELTQDVAENITSSFWPDTEKIVAIAREATKMTGAEWRRAVEAGIRAPNAPIKEILAKARIPPVRVELRIPVDPSTHEALKKMARGKGIDVETLVTTAITNLLDEEGP
jgi:ParB/RepB/Spo0J family partition protein